MKFKFLIGLLAIFGLVSVQACSDDDDDRLDDVSQVFVDALKKLYPTATDVKWENKAPYRVAEFNKNNGQIGTEVWFDINANWKMTELDYGKNLFMLPTVINDAFTQTEYCRAPWNVDDIEEYKRPTDNFFIIEVESPQQGEVSLLFSDDGTLLKTVNGDLDNITPDYQL